MFCTNCGARLEDGAKFCTNCGSPVGDNAPAAESVSVPESNEHPADPQLDQADSVAETKPKKKWKLLIPIIAAAVVVVFVAVALAFPTLANFFSRAFSSPEDYYHKVERGALEDVVGSVGNYYGRILDAAGKSMDVGVNATAELTAGKALQKLLTEEELDEQLGWLGSVLAELSFSRKDQLAGGDVTLKLNKDKIVSVSFFADLAEQAFFAQIPELSKNYLTVDGDDLGAMNYLLYSIPRPARDLFTSVGSPGSVQEEQIVEALKALPAQPEFEKLLEKYLYIAVNDIEHVEKGRDTLTAGEISAKYATLKVEIDRETAQSIATDVFTELRKDPEVRKYITDAAMALDQDGNEVYERFLDALEDAEDALDRASGGEETLKMTLYVDGTGKIAGREISHGETSVKYAVVNKGGSGGIECSAKKNGSTLFSLSGAGKLSGSSLKGELTLKTADSSIMTVIIDRFNMMKLRQGYLDGVIRIKPSRQLIEELYLPATVESLVRRMSLTLECNTSRSSSDVKFVLNTDSDMLVTLEIDSKTSTAKKISRVNDAFAPQEWVENLKESDVRTFIRNLKKTDIPTELIEELEDSMDYLF